MNSLKKKKPYKIYLDSCKNIFRAEVDRSSSLTGFFLGGNEYISYFEIFDTRIQKLSSIGAFRNDFCEYDEIDEGKKYFNIISKKMTKKFSFSDCDFYHNLFLKKFFHNRIVRIWRRTYQETPYDRQLFETTDEYVGPFVIFHDKVSKGGVITRRFFKDPDENEENPGKLIGDIQTINDSLIICVEFNLLDFKNHKKIFDYQWKV